MRNSVSEIALKDCLDKFNLLYCQQNQSVVEQFKGTRNKFDMYVCRYKIFKSDGKYCIEPYVTPKPIVQNKENLPTAIDVNQNILQSSPTKRKVEPIIIQKHGYSDNKSTGRRSVASRSTSHPNILSSDEDDNFLSPRKRSKSDRYGNNSKTAKTSVCRNLNDSMGEVLNYSIEEQDDLKIKFKVSEQQPQNTPTRRTRSKSLLKSTIDSPPTTPTKSSLRESVLLRTPKSSKPSSRKSILKTPSTTSVGKKDFI